MAQRHLWITTQFQVVDVFDFIELKAESDSNGEQATGHITTPGIYGFSWYMGPIDGQDFWTWMDNLNGTVGYFHMFLYASDLTGQPGGTQRYDAFSSIYPPGVTHRSNGEIQLSAHFPALLNPPPASPGLVIDAHKPIDHFRIAR